MKDGKLAEISRYLFKMDEDELEERLEQILMGLDPELEKGEVTDPTLRFIHDHAVNADISEHKKLLLMTIYQHYMIRDYQDYIKEVHMNSPQSIVLKADDYPITPDEAEP